MAANSYDSRDLVWVTPFGGSSIKYGFLTNAPAATRTACGHNAIAADYPTGLVIGANAPKPGRASKRTATGTNGSFYDIGQRATLRTDGWSLTYPKIRRGSTGANSNAVYVNLGSIKYAWRMPKTTYTKVGGDRAVLGIEDATSNDTDLVWGASYPKPPKASKVEVGADGTNVISTFVDTSAVDSLPDGWSTSSGEEYLGPGTP